MALSSTGEGGGRERRAVASCLQGGIARERRATRVCTDKGKGALALSVCRTFTAGSVDTNCSGSENSPVSNHFLRA